MSLPDDVDQSFYDEKYLLIHIVEKNKWLVLSRRFRFHSQIFSSWKREQQDYYTYNIYGGGIVHIEAGEVKTYGMSGGYGRVQPEDLPKVRKCLEKLGLNIKEVICTDYVRE